MFVEILDSENRSAVFTSFFAATAKALVVVFDKGEQEARSLVEALSSRFADAPTREQNFLLHNDPVAMACILAEVPWAAVDAERLEAFNHFRRHLPPSKL